RERADGPPGPDESARRDPAFRRGAKMAPDRRGQEEVLHDRRAGFGTLEERRQFPDLLGAEAPVLELEEQFFQPAHASLPAGLNCFSTQSLSAWRRRLRLTMTPLRDRLRVRPISAIERPWSYFIFRRSRA